VRAAVRRLGAAVKPLKSKGRERFCASEMATRVPLSRAGVPRAKLRDVPNPSTDIVNLSRAVVPRTHCLSASTITAPEETVPTPPFRRSFLLVFSCTLIGALAQLLIKTGAGQLGVHLTLTQVLKDPMLVFQFGFRIVENFRLFIGYSLYGVNTVLMAYALKGRELSRLYPIIALTYVWVTGLSLLLLPAEHINVFRLIGITLIVAGVSVLGGTKLSRGESA
jgi:multidrug transporter EmrE-like cation transporter